MKKILLILIPVVAIFSLVLYLNSTRKKQAPATSPTPTTFEISPTKTEEKVDITASFEIYTNTTKRIFTASMYHNLSEDVYITSDNPSIIHVKKAGVTWADFFATLPMKLSKDCLVTGTKQTFCTGQEGSLRFYINDIENPEALDEIINEDNFLKVTYGSN